MSWLTYSTAGSFPEDSQWCMLQTQIRFVKTHVYMSYNGLAMWNQSTGTTPVTVGPGVCRVLVPVSLFLTLTPALTGKTEP